jgi:AraC-like DNA-binding protein
MPRSSPLPDKPRDPPRIAPIGFENPRLDAVGVEVVTLAGIRKFAAATLVRPQRVGFHGLLLMQEGEGEHTVDFKRYALRPGTLIYVRPGQVQQWHMHPGLQGELLLMKPEALGPAIGRAELDTRLLAAHQWPPRLQADEALRGRLSSDLARLRAEIAGFDGSEVQAAIIWHTLLATLLRVAQAMRATRAPADHAAATVFALLEQVLAEEGHVRKTVSALARRLGYSESTLNRACLAMAEKSTKRLLDERTALEAKRFLVHSQASITEIGRRLGFSEATNFVKFFSRLTRTTPQAFRARYAGPSGGRDP